MSVYGIGQPKLTKVAVVPVERPKATQGVLDSLNITHFRQFWDLMDTVQVHGYVRAAMSVIGRSAVGAWWSLIKDEEWGKGASERQRKRLMKFYAQPDKQWDNIKDFQSITYKVMIGAMYLRYFGQTAYQILRNKEGVAIGLDHLPGYMFPNVDDRGYFKSPAFIQYPTANPLVKVPFESARDIVYIINPDWTGRATGGTDIEALSEFAIPIDLYLQVAAREYMKNRDKPEAFYVLPSDVSDEAFEAFSKAIADRYAGPSNVGRNPITVAGELDIKEMSQLPADLPYQDARADTRQELLAVSGVAGAKLGITESLSSANLREARREFHESTMVPLFRLIETGLYEQIHVREFGIQGWTFKFGNPDFLNAVEKATVHMRYIQFGVYSPNEARHDLGMPNRKGGDVYVDPAAAQKKQQQNPQGNPPEGRQDRPDSPNNTSEPTNDNQDPPRGDGHDDTTDRSLVLDELKRWKKFATKRFGKSSRKFETERIPNYLYQVIDERLETCRSVQDVLILFTETIQLIEEELGCE